MTPNRGGLSKKRSYIQKKGSHRQQRLTPSRYLVRPTHGNRGGCFVARNDPEKAGGGVAKTNSPKPRGAPGKKDEPYMAFNRRQKATAGGRGCRERERDDPKNAEGGGCHKNDPQTVRAVAKKKRSQTEEGLAKKWPKNGCNRDHRVRVFAVRYVKMKRDRKVGQT